MKKPLISHYLGRLRRRKANKQERFSSLSLILFWETETWYLQLSQAHQIMTVLGFHNVLLYQRKAESIIIIIIFLLLLILYWIVLLENNGNLLINWGDQIQIFKGIVYPKMFFFLKFYSTSSHQICLFLHLNRFEEIQHCITYSLQWMGAISINVRRMYLVVRIFWNFYGKTRQEYSLRKLFLFSIIFPKNWAPSVRNIWRVWCSSDVSSSF